jgi:hypothetical protein
MMTEKIGRKALLLTLTAALMTACSDSTPTGPGFPGSGDGAAVSLSVAVTATGAANGALSPAFDVVMDDGQNNLTIDRVAIVLREIELKLQNDNGCDDSSDGFDDDSCEEFEVGPVLLELPLDGSVETVVAINDVPAGVYDELEFDIHKPDDDTQADRDFLQQHPDFRRVSIRVEGQFNGSNFLYLTDLNEEQEINLVPPVVIDGGANPTNVTLLLDLDSWFRFSDGTLFNPASANEDGPNEEIAEDNIERSIDGFEDEDRDGDDDADDEDGDDSSDDDSSDDDSSDDDSSDDDSSDDDS